MTKTLDMWQTKSWLNRYMAKKWHRVTKTIFLTSDFFLSLSCHLPLRRLDIGICFPLQNILQKRLFRFFSSTFRLYTGFSNTWERGKNHKFCLKYLKSLLHLDSRKWRKINCKSSVSPHELSRDLKQTGLHKLSALQKLKLESLKKWSWTYIIYYSPSLEIIKLIAFCNTPNSVCVYCFKFWKYLYYFVSWIHRKKIMFLVVSNHCKLLQCYNNLNLS